MYRLVQPHAASFIAHTEASTGSELPRFIKDEFDAFLECGILAHGFPRLRCGERGHDKLLAFRCKRRAFCPSCGAAGVRRVVTRRLQRAAELKAPRPRRSGDADPALRLGRQPQHPPALPGSRRRVPVRRRWRLLQTVNGLPNQLNAPEHRHQLLAHHDAASRATGLAEGL